MRSSVPLAREEWARWTRARDTALDRDVALKILPDVFADDADRLMRFTREAKTLASLNHPNIAAIYGIEGRAIVMELVDGQDLSEVIARAAPRGLSSDDALPIARQIIDALEAAHDQGIVHRDLKPANVRVRADGTVKVLDFGLAKALQPAEGLSSTDNSPTLTARATQMGMVIGTAAYMSPEQARGRAVDKRTDVWAFGCVLYEMLSGRKAFDGEDATEIISAVVKTEPDWSALPDQIPARVRAVVTRCLVKDRKARIPDLSVVRYILDDANPAVAPAAAAAPVSARSSARLWQAVAAILLVATMGAGAAWYFSRASPAVTRFFITPPTNQMFTSGPIAGSTVPVVSPDGRIVAFTAQDGTGKRLLWIRAIDSLTAQPLADTDNASYPFWSPDSRSIGYSISNKLMRVAANGGPPTPLCALRPGIIARGGSWNRDGVIVFNNGPGPLYRVASSGGDAKAMGPLDAGTIAQEFPSFLPDGRRFLYHASGGGDAGGVYAASLDGGDRTLVLPSNSGAIYDQTSGHLLFVRQGTLLAQLFDPKRLKVTGDAFPIAEKVEASAVPGLVAFSLSDTGLLVYGIGRPAATGLQMVWVDRTGKVTGSAGPEARYRGINLSPDGQQIAAHREEPDGGDIWLTEVAGNKTSRFTFDESQENAAPVWSPEGNRIAFASTRDGKPGISVRFADGTGSDERVFESSTTRNIAPQSWSPDGLSIVFEINGATTGTDLWRVETTGEHKASPLVQSPFSESHGQISPDGRWLAYVSNEASTAEVYVRSTTPGGGKWPISSRGGNAPRWRGDNQEVFYVAGGKMWAAPVSTRGAAFVPGEPKALFDYNGIPFNTGHYAYFSYAVAKDGRHILISRAPSDAETTATPSPIVVVVNWRDGIRR